MSECIGGCVGGWVERGGKEMERVSAWVGWEGGRQMERVSECVCVCGWEGR